MKLVTLAQGIALADQPPTEIRLFAAGVNNSTKGPAVFDAAAAKAVMAEFNRQGNDAMIDLEHLSLDPKAPNYDPDARAWFDLEVRNGELWAVDIKWTPDGTDRVVARKQRYLSPAFYTDKEDRVIALVNVGLTALPATHEAPPLIAANRHQARAPKTRNEGNTMDPNQISEALDALMAGDDAKCVEILKGIISTAAGGGAAATDAEAMADPEKDPAAMADPTKDPTEQMVAACKKIGEAIRLSRDVAKSLETEAPKVLSKIKALQSGATEGAKLASRVATLEADAGKREVDDLIKANTKKIPPTLDAWARAQSPEALRAFLKDAPDVVTTPAGPVTEPTVNLTESAAALCERNKIDPKKFAAMRSQMRRGQE